MKRYTSILALVFLMTNYYGYGQSMVDSTSYLVGDQLTGDISIQDSIKVQVKRNSDETICYQISLEKKISDNWIPYTDDVFNPHRKTITTCALTNEQSTYSFTINTPEYFEPEQNREISAPKEIHHKVGLFRLKIRYGTTSDNLTESFYLPEFTIAEKTKNKKK